MNAKNREHLNLLCDIDASVCGEMGHDPDFAPFFLGIGLRRFSVDPRFLPVLQVLFRQVSCRETERYADELLQAASIEAVQAVVRAWRFAERIQGQASPNHTFE